MNKNRLFSKTRSQLAVWFVSVMAIILIICELSLDRALSQAYKANLDRELTSVANTLHNGFLTILERPEKLKSNAAHLLPDICFDIDACYEADNSSLNPVKAIYQIEYYVRLLNPEGKPTAIAGKRIKSLPVTPNKSEWLELVDNDGFPYRQTTLTLHTKDDRVWGYLQVGRSLREVKKYTSTMRRVLIVGFPLILGLISVGAWWLVGKVMQPVYRSYRQIQQFTADAAHELRTPLAAIRATVESSLMKTNLSETIARNTLQTIGRQNQRLSQIVSDLMILSRLERQLSGVRTSVTTESVILNDLVSDIAEEFAALAISANLELKLQIDTSRNLTVKGNSEQLYRLISNLVINAIKYTSAEGKVTIILESERNEAIMRVRDTGIGIAPSEQKRIFDRFYRVSSDRSRQTGGSGLGLAIAKAIAQAHEGTIEVTSELGIGSTFKVCLPLKN
ncbi:integral membrane sensor signal transduction histidine kinase (plasmid) [Stanieria cyanosphaera PCC 7437]|uniref:histidine kinase n=1 Tax=Stanieria cyanosphaera (strain ATCC 29371 / PCC 7437) TaxID=111780 RepID=K9Y2J0_STAC7|nr:two-component system sensor histidine kinase RppB [Stanieria cyanosphaera]AFZ38232.1 integral membrane sensor signal transduction histidine kinase [Stanieria cyanosphaera PCC 7437]